MTDEQWKPIPGWEGFYEVSDQGRVRSLDRRVERCDGQQRPVRGQLRQPRSLAKSGGHLIVGLSRDNSASMHCVHALVLLAFVGPRPDGLDGCHNNGDPSDNRLANLRYDTKSANQLDSVRHGTHHHARKTHCKYGHPFDGANTYLTQANKRGCRICRRAAWRAWAEKRRNRTARVSTALASPS